MDFNLSEKYDMRCHDWRRTLEAMKTLQGKIAVVGGASRGAGRGIALALGEAGATVYVAARTTRGGPKPSDGAPGTVEDTAEQVTARGGVGMAAAADLSDEAQVAALFGRVEREQGRLDLLANSAWAGNIMSQWGRRFWNLTPGLFAEALDTLATYCWTSIYAARLMARQKHGLIVHVTDNFFPDPHADRGQILWDFAHEGLNRLIAAMARDAGKAKFAVVGMNPGFMRTERVLMSMKDDATKLQFRFDLSESPEYIGRAIAALAADPDAARFNGQLLWACDLAEEYGFTDTDGRRIPRFDPKAPLQPMPC
jgi:NAD(P)-dependent dehydrogenase (short-subunit alcohol dehydrogenase family)